MTQVVEFNSLKARTYSRLGQRGAIFGLGIFDAIGQNSSYSFGVRTIQKPISG